MQSEITAMGEVIRRGKKPYYVYRTNNRTIEGNFRARVGRSQALRAGLSKLFFMYATLASFHFKSFGRGEFARRR